MQLSNFNFFLPKDLIAQTPAPLRDQSRLMIVDRQTKTIRHDSFSNLASYLVNHPMMVFNNTQVIPSKLIGQRKDTGKSVEILLVREKGQNTWETLVKGLGGIKIGSELVFGTGNLTAVMVEKEDGRGILRFRCCGELRSALERIAKTPLPPYIKRGNEHSMENLDRERYQTIYAAQPGAIAAPTAGLHFTDALLNDISSNHAKVVFLTLHIGPSTFQTIRTKDILKHSMGKEYFHIPKKTWNNLVHARKEKQKILAVGTTTTRTLESVNLFSETQSDISGWTDRFIYPTYEFKNVQQLLTNFHLPKSTLFLLVCAFAGKELMKRAYKIAMHKKYRFFSYGDAMLIL